MWNTWTVVTFPEENTVEAVPTSWINNGKCYFPSIPADKLATAIRNNDLPNTKWPSYNVRILRNSTCGTLYYYNIYLSNILLQYVLSIDIIVNTMLYFIDNYAAAKEKCRKAQYSSDLDSDVPSKTLGKRSRISKKSNDCPSSDTDEDDDGMMDNTSILPSPPQINGLYS